jgi:hypothetical protein
MHNQGPNQIVNLHQLKNEPKGKNTISFNRSLIILHDTINHNSFH